MHAVIVQTVSLQSALPCPALPCPALPCPALPCPALCCPSLPYAAARLSTLNRHSQPQPRLLAAAGSPYELGPYPSEVAAAQAYDRYSMLLHGAKAQVRTAAAYSSCHTKLLALPCTAAASRLVVKNMRARENTICTPLASKVQNL